MGVDSDVFFKALSAQRAPPTVTLQELDQHTKQTRQKMIDRMSSMDRELSQLYSKTGAAERAINEAQEARERAEEELANVNKEKDRASRVLYRTVQEKAELEAELLQEEQKLVHIRTRLMAVGIERERLSKNLTDESMLLQEERMKALQVQRTSLAEKEAIIAREIVELTDSVNKGLELKARRMEQLKSVLAGD